MCRSVCARLSLLLTALLIACAGMVESDVVAFHRLQQTHQPVRYLFYELEDQRRSLEYKTYQDMVRAELSKHQYSEVKDISEADVIIAFNYGIDSGREKLETIPVFGQTGVSSSFTSGTITSSGSTASYSGTTTYNPTYGIVGTMTDSRTEYTRGLWLYMVDANELRTHNKVEIIYEGRVMSAGSSAQLAKVMPAMVTALFKEFPGKSGATRRASVPLQ